MSDPAWEEIKLLRAENVRLSSQKEELQRELTDTKYDLQRWDDGGCWYCMNPDIEDPWRHEHEPNGGHWHHCIDPGDGLPSDCKNSERLERVFAELQREKESLTQQLAVTRHYEKLYLTELRECRERIEALEQALAVMTKDRDVLRLVLPEYFATLKHYGEQLNRESGRLQRIFEDVPQAVDTETKEQPKS